jgi:hypothetical protein
MYAISIYLVCMSKDLQHWDLFHENILQAQHSLFLKHSQT